MKDGKVRDNRYLLFFRALESIDFGNLPEISLALGIFSGKMLTEQLVRFLFNKALQIKENKSYFCFEFSSFFDNKIYFNIFSSKIIRHVPIVSILWGPTCEDPNSRFMFINIYILYPQIFQIQLFCLFLVFPLWRKNIFPLATFVLLSWAWRHLYV